MKALDNAYYIALSFHILKPDTRAYSDYLRAQAIPFYRLHNEKKMLQDYSIYTHRLTAEKHGDFPSWNSLHLIQLDRRESAASLMNELKHLQPFPDAILVRQELLVSTPGSHFPSFHPSVKRWFKPMQVVEHVDVLEDKLDEFRHIMEHRNGPAMNYIISNRHWCSSFHALETVEIWQHHDDYPTWNQLHIIALYPDAPLWYKRDFGQGLAGTGLSFEDNMDELRQIRTMRYKTISSLLKSY
ncbi:hypothetical protein [Paenibacillus massiliensis]|uniref:hypothetical protein n=1 Tax=Paenibacillus massiliensis TaxID=225917 RepID=UPI00047141A3|nr:hypothetical protein [Paenibacillus massiliensis]